MYVSPENSQKMRNTAQTLAAMLRAALPMTDVTVVDFPTASAVMVDREQVASIGLLERWNKKQRRTDRVVRIGITDGYTEKSHRVETKDGIDFEGIVAKVLELRADTLRKRNEWAATEAMNKQVQTLIDNSKALIAAQIEGHTFNVRPFCSQTRYGAWVADYVLRADTLDELSDKLEQAIPLVAALVTLTK